LKMGRGWLLCPPTIPQLYGMNKIVDSWLKAVNDLNQERVQPLLQNQIAAIPRPLDFLLCYPSLSQLNKAFCGREDRTT